MDGKDGKGDGGLYFEGVGGPWRRAARNKMERIHFVGVGGAGMSGLAEVMRQMGYSVSGSDAREQPSLARLRAAGVRVFVGHAAENGADADCVVYSGAVAADNVERRAAEARGAPVVPRAKMLGELMRFKPGIAVAGTHGKTTTASMVAAVLSAAGLSPTCVIGGRLLAREKDGALLGDGDYVVAEADESDASFLHLQPSLAVVTNIDNDHLDAFGGEAAALQEAFLGFLENLPFYGTAVICADDARARAAAAAVKTSRCVLYGFAQEAAVRAAAVKIGEGGTEFALELFGEKTAAFVRAVGRHNVLNALAAAAVGWELGAARADILRGLAEFGGVGRRLEVYGEARLAGRRVLLVDDYAHHPTEIAATLAALRAAYAGRRLLLVFQPHRYSRTAALLDELAVAVGGADAVLLAGVYAAGEEAGAAGPAGADIAEKLFAAIPAHTEKAFCAEWEDLAAAAADFAGEFAADGDLLVTMGAGNIGSLPGILRGGAE